MAKDLPIVVLGGGAVGKSCITIQYIQGHFVKSYDATIEDIYRKRVNIDGRQEVLMIVDTAGQEAFGTMREQYMKSGLGFVLVYSITDSESFLQLKTIYAHLRRTKGEGAVLPCIVVGNKTDLANQRAVSLEEGQMFANQVKCPFVEVSAINRGQVEDLFATLVRSIHNLQEGGNGAAAASVTSSSNNNNGDLSASTMQSPQRDNNNNASGGANGNASPTTNNNNNTSGTAPATAAPGPTPAARPTAPPKKKWPCTIL